MQTKKALPPLTARLKLGARLRVSPVCVGMVRDERTVSAAFDAGINFFFFSADMHWPLYEPLRRGLRALLKRRRSIRDEIVVAAVSYVTQPEFCQRPFEEAIEAVPGLKRLDVSVIGGSYASDFFSRVDQYQRNREGPLRGRTIALGASFHDRKAAANAIAHGVVDIAYCRYNAAHRGAETDIFPKIGDKPRTRLLYSFTSMSGYVPPARCDQLGVSKQSWRPTETDHYRFALTPKSVDGVLCGPQTPAQVRALEEALSKGPLSKEEREYLGDLADLHAGRAVMS